MAKTKEPKIHRDTWKQVLSLGDWVMISTSHKMISIGKLVRFSDAGSWWIERLPGPGQKYTGKPVLYLSSERIQSIKIEVDETVQASLIITEAFTAPPKITVSLQ